MEKPYVMPLLLLCLLPVLPLAAQQVDECPQVRIEAERLPDLTIPRTGHSIFYAGDELTLVGGRTTNFVPTPTAEYFANGAWHQLTMAYAHDDGFAAVMPSGEVVIGGGHSEELGVGQTFLVERYDPTTHNFEGFGCLDRRRALASALLLGNGNVIISGNHYTDDAIACYDGKSQIQHIKDVAQGRSNPYILRTAADDALILGAHDTRQQTPDAVWADRLKGDAFRVPLLEQWRLVYTDQPFNSDICALHNPSISQSDYSYLLTATDESGQLGIVMVSNQPNDQMPSFSLLPTVCPIPMHSQFGPIAYKGPVVVDRERQRGYVIGVDDSLCNRQYILAIDYARQPAALTLYHTDTLEHATVAIPILTPGGDLILAGGVHHDNYKPFATVWCYHFGTAMAATAVARPQGGFPWLWVLLALGAVALIITVVRAVGTHQPHEPHVALEPHETHDPHELIEAHEPIESNESYESHEHLLHRLCALLDEQQLYLVSHLRQKDVASELGVSVSAITESLAACRGINFTQLLAEYRVRHAQQLLSGQPDIKLVAVFRESGFTSESTFFRTFKAVTGLSPKEWLAANTDKTFPSPV